MRINFTSNRIQIAAHYLFRTRLIFVLIHFSDGAAITRYFSQKYGYRVTYIHTNVTALSHRHRYKFTTNAAGSTTMPKRHYSPV